MMLRFAVRATGALALAMLAGCSILPSSLSLPSFLGGGAEKPKPAELQPNPSLLAVSPAWTAKDRAGWLSPLRQHQRRLRDRRLRRWHGRRDRPGHRA